MDKSPGYGKGLTSRTAVAVALLCIMLVALVYRSALWSVPLERDEGEYAYIAWRSGYGELPYREWFDQKPPGVFWVYRAALALPLDPVRAIHLAGAVACGLAAVALFVAASAFSGLFGALAAALIFIVMTSDPFIQGAASNTELFMLMPLIGAHAVFLHGLLGGQRSAKSAVAVGLLCAVASMFKQVAVFDLAFFIAAYIVVGNGGRIKDAAWMALSSGAGFIVPWLMVSAYFAAHGGFAEFMDAVLLHNLRYVSTVPLAERWGNLSYALSRILSAQGVVWAGAGAGAVLLWRTGGRGKAAYLLGWLVAGSVGASASGYYFEHYFLPMLAPMALMVAFGVVTLRDRHKLKSGIGAALAVTVMLAQPLAGYLPFVLEYSPREAAAAIYPGNLFADMPAIAGRMAAITGPDDTIFVMGAEAELYFYAKRKSASRYIFLFPLYGDYPDALARQKDVMREIERNRPRAIAYVPNMLLFGPGHEMYLQKSLEAYIQNGYELDSLIEVDDDFNVVMLSEPDEPSPDLNVLGWIVRRRP